MQDEDSGMLVDLADYDKNAPIKVIGVGGGGGNAVANMYRERIGGVNFLVCNSDGKALASSPVPDRLQIGPGLGCGGRPEQGEKYAEESLAAIGRAFGENTKMVFVTAGMGGGTGTGASPIIAREARKRGLLTIGIVTIPFLFELNHVIDKALDGLERLADEVDSLLVINNERLKEIYSDISVFNAFKKADDVLTVAARSIVEIINMRGTMNLDFTDVYNTLHEGGVAIISTGYGSGENRFMQAIQDAITSPLLNNNDVYRATHFVMRITTSSDEQNALQMDELGELQEFMSHFSPELRTKYGLDTDDSLGDKVKVTLLASGFGLYGKKAKQPKVEEEVENEENVVRRENFYPMGSPQGSRLPKRNHIYVFGGDDLENEDVMELVEETPTYHRSRRELENIKTTAGGRQQTAAADSEETSRYIKFTE